MNIAELRQLTTKKLWVALKKARRELAVTRFHVQTGQEQNTAKIKKQKKLIAQISTLLNAKKEA